MRIVARFVRTGVKLQLLEVKAPRQATIKVTCSTRARPRALRRQVAAANGNGSRRVKFRQFARRFIAGVKLEIRVSRGSNIGAYTRFTVRRRRVPLRVDACLDPGAVKPIRCPA